MFTTISTVSPITEEMSGKEKYCELLTRLCGFLGNKDDCLSSKTLKKLIIADDEWSNTVLRAVEVQAEGGGE